LQDRGVLGVRRDKKGQSLGCQGVVRAFLSDEVVMVFGLLSSFNGAVSDLARFRAHPTPIG